MPTRPTAATPYPVPYRQRGVVLVVSMIMLLMMTLIGLTSIQTVTLDERMVGNAHQRNVAFQAAEAGLRAGENLIQGDTMPAFDGATPGIVDRWNNPSDTPTDWIAYAWDADHSQAYSGTLDSALAAQPRYVIELMAIKPGADSLDATQPGAPISQYRVTARGSGNGRVGDAVALLQSVYQF